MYGLPKSPFRSVDSQALSRFSHRNGGTQSTRCIRRPYLHPRSHKKRREYGYALFCEKRLREALSDGDRRSEVLRRTSTYITTLVCPDPWPPKSKRLHFRILRSRSLPAHSVRCLGHKT